MLVLFLSETKVSSHVSPARYFNIGCFTRNAKIIHQKCAIRHEKWKMASQKGSIQVLLRIALFIKMF